MNNEGTGFTITWFIENYSYCMHQKGEGLNTPEFIADGLEGTAWYLDLFPRGYQDKNKGYLSLFLNRCKVDDGPEELPLKYEISVLSEDGSALSCRECTYTFRKGSGYGRIHLVQMEEIFFRRKADYLPHDTLTVQCTIWWGEGQIQDIKKIAVRTRIGIKQITFLHAIENFYTLEPNQKKTVDIRSPSKKGLDLTSSLYFTDDYWCDGKIIVEISPSDINQILSRCKLSLLDGSGILIPCGDADNRYDATRKNIQRIPLSLTRQIILNRKDEFFINDKLNLLCECTFSTGVEYENIENTVHELPLVALNEMNNKNHNKDIPESAEKLSDCTSALDDLKEIYNNQFLADVELKTKTKTFLAHKIVLCARSSVLKAMLTNDMKEKKTNCIEVDDLENDTIQQLLLFMYSDHLENLQWESAINLYYAGDKYAIGKLKLLCSSFLVKNLSTSTASELLLLADTHNDCHLKKTVEDFIFKHEEEVFGSDEWGNLLETNPLLVSRTMRLKYKR